MRRHSRYAPVGEYRSFHIAATATSLPIGNNVSTTSSTTISAGNDVVVTPASMGNIVAGMLLNFANGTGTAEDVRVKTVGASTFTADFVNGHSGAYTIISRRSTSLGSITINKVGTSDIMTLYDGHPSVLPNAGRIIAVITPTAGSTLQYLCSCDQGLFYTVAGTAGDYTVNYLDQDV
jgi:hypothetical protein